MISVLEQAENELASACPERLERLTQSLRPLPVLALSCPPEQREAVLARLSEFQRNLHRFGEVLQRGSAFLEGYSRRAGLSDEGYAPRRQPVSFEG